MKIKYYIALWFSKILIIVLKLTKHNGTNLPGTYALKICPDFLKYADKPKTIYAVTGTNGKTTTTNLLCDVFENDGKKVLSNRYGSNLITGISTSLIKGMNIFGKQRYEMATFEMDERSAKKLYPYVKPDYLIVSNLARDSIGRNAHPEYIFNFLNEALKFVEDKTTLILNSNDPLSSNLNEKNKRIYIGMADANCNAYINSAPDVSYCPKCGGKILYNYRFYRSLGNFTCEDCDYKSQEAKYFAKKVDLENRKLYLEDGNELVEFPLLSNTIYNAINVLAVIALLKEIGYENDRIYDLISKSKILDSRREDMVLYNGVEYSVYVAKGQLASSSSTLFEYLAKDKKKKDLVFCIDEETSGSHPDETLTWMYEADFEFLNSPTINKIITTGHMCHNTKLRLLLAGIPYHKIVALENEHEAKYYVSKSGIDKVYVLNDIDTLKRGYEVRNEIVEYMKDNK